MKPHVIAANAAQTAGSLITTTLLLDSPTPPVVLLSPGQASFGGLMLAFRDAIGQRPQVPGSAVLHPE